MYLFCCDWPAHFNIAVLSLQMALMKHKGLFELLEKHGQMLLDTKLQTASQVTRIAIITMLEELAPNLWEDDLNRLVDFGHLISPALEMVTNFSHVFLSF